MYPCYYPSNRSIKALIINTWRALKILPKEKPDLIISSGAAPAIPFFWIGKLMGAKTIYIEVFDRIDASTIAGKLCYPVTDKFIVEWEEMKTVYPKAINLGSIFSVSYTHLDVYKRQKYNLLHLLPTSFLSCGLFSLVSFPYRLLQTAEW